MDRMQKNRLKRERAERHANVRVCRSVVEHPALNRTTGVQFSPDPPKCKHPEKKRKVLMPPPWMAAGLEVCECGAERYEGERYWRYPDKNDE